MSSDNHTVVGDGSYTDVSSGALKIQTLLKLVVDHEASDLHIVTGSPPAIRVSGSMVRVKGPPLNREDAKRLIYQVLTEEQRNQLEKSLELDFSFGVRGLARFRGNVFYARGSISGAFRLIPADIPDFKTLNLPNNLLHMTDVLNGLILITGPTGSGKSTTLASLLDRLNENESGHIVTIEDPIEFVHGHKGCLVNQREIGADTDSFAVALKSLLRQDPDIVLIGEMRDKETIEAAVTIAETGHLVFGTLHTNSCVQTINRLVNVFPTSQQEQIRTVLSFVLQGVVSQQLVPKCEGRGRALALEMLIPTQAVRTLIRDDKLHQLYSQMQTGQKDTGMVTMNQSLKAWVDKRVIDIETALSYTTAPSELRKMLRLKEE